jgi:hypothetical protein
MAIKSIEWLGMFEAKELIVKSTWMRDEVIRVYKVPVEKIRVVSPGSDKWIDEIMGAYEHAVGGSR